MRRGEVGGLLVTMATRKEIEEEMLGNSYTN
jgi:hypothetical protein